VFREATVIASIPSDALVLRRVRRGARTIADLGDGAPVVIGRPVAEALPLLFGRGLLVGEQAR
jgi:hypothetical protein